MKRESKPRLGSRVSIESLDGTYRGKIVAISTGEAVIKWDGSAEETLIDVMDLLKPDGSSFDSYKINARS